MKRALRNVIENAVAYGEHAAVSMKYKDGHARITVDDRGPGIPDADMEKVFKPFVRLEASRNKETGGVGLGLAIAHSIVLSHGGDIRLQNRPGGGLRVLLCFSKVSAIAAPCSVEKPELQGPTPEAQDLMAEITQARRRLKPPGFPAM